MYSFHCVYYVSHHNHNIYTLTSLLYLFNLFISLFFNVKLHASLFSWLTNVGCMCIVNYHKLDKYVELPNLPE